jgi:hypothetical protein
MPKLNQFPRLITALLWCGFCVLMSAPLAYAEDFCAVTLNVTKWDGSPSGAWIELLDPAGKIVRKESFTESAHQICDFGFGPHTLRVGTNSCLPVAISNIRVVFGFPLNLHVRLDGCGYQEQMRNACLLYLRIVDEFGKPIPEVGFSPILVLNIPQRTDSYGRYQSLFKGNHDTTFTKPGYESATVHLQCRDTEEVDKEVVLKKLAALE